MRRLYLFPLALLILVLALILLHGPSTPSLPLNQSSINEIFGPGKILNSSGVIEISNGTPVLKTLGGLSIPAYDFLGVYLPSQVKGGVVEEVEGNGYHLLVVYLELKDVVPSNYTQVVNGTNDTILIVHRGYGEVDLTYFGGHLSQGQIHELVAMLVFDLRRGQ